MKNRIKLLFMCSLLVAVLLVEPAAAVYAAEGTYSEDVPYLQGLEFNMHVNAESNRGVVLDTVMKSKTVDTFTFQFPKLDNVKYENYDVVFDMTLKSKLENGSITTHQHTERLDIVTSGKPGFFNGLLMSIGLKDSAYKISMDFETLIKNSPDIIATEKWVSDNLSFTAKKVYEYNTVITQVDCYLVEKETGNYGLISSFILTWDSDFRNALCTNVTYNLVTPETNEVLESGSNSNSSGAYGYDSSGDNADHEARSVLTDIVGFFTDIPASIVAFFTGFVSLSESLQELITVVFPFIPANVVSIFIIMLGFILLLSVYRLLRGLFE